jgi:tetratricopeptide (TPR) repeat protein
VHAYTNRQFAKFAILLILALATVAHGPSLANGFTNWDDPMLVVENPAIRSLSPGNIIEIFTPTSSSFQPIRVLSYAVDYAIWGDRAFGYHLGNLLLHLAAAVLLFFAMSALLARLRSSHAENREAALLVALLFAVHPVNVESVAWVSSRKYGLLAVFGFFAIYAFLRATRSEPDRRWLAASVVAQVLAILSSPFAVVLPALLALVNLAAPRQANWRAMLPHVLALGLLALPLAPGLSTASKHSTEAGIRVGAFAHAPAEALLRTYTMSRVLFDYGRNLCCPLWLNNNYINRLEVSLLNFKILLTWVALIVLAIFCRARWRRGERLPAFCAAWAFICWLPVSNIIPISTSMADRYLYLAAIGPFLALALGLERWTQGQTHRQAALRIVATVLALFTLGSANRSRIWYDSESLWRDSIAKQASNPVAHYNLGAELLQKKQIEQGIQHLQTALKHGMGTPGAYNNLAHGLMLQGKYHEASLNAREALYLQPKNPRRHAQLAQALLKSERSKSAARFFNSALALDPEMVVAWVGLGRAELENGELDAATLAFRAAMRRREDLPEIHNGLGMAHAAAGDDTAAAVSFRAALELGPNFAEAHFNLGTVLNRAGETDAANAEFAKTIELREDHPEAWNNWGMALANSGKHEEALAKFSKALELDPKYAQAIFNMANTNRNLGKPGEAEAHYHESIKLRPRYAPAYNNLGTLLLDQGRLAEAASEFAKAVQFDREYPRAHYNLGNLAMQQKDYESAIGHFSTAVSFDTNYFAAHFNLAALYAQRGEPADALYHLGEAARLQPDHPNVRALQEQLGN